MKFNEMLFVNDHTINYFEKKFNLKFVDETKDNICISSIDDKNSWTIKSYLNYFFKSLTLNIPSRIDFLYFDEGKSINEILYDLSSKDIILSNSFVNI